MPIFWVRSFGPEGQNGVVSLLVASNTEVKASQVMTSMHLAAAFSGSVTGSFTDATSVVRGFVASPNT
ncbi:MAG: hypothetical protein DMG43_11265 [Acidobacteria bacterium]|nr:MAG: hypothetical protein DMG43_11265 [Acidobacteriota bacterium]